jgi:YVTN family beta-propeller protein
VTAADATTQDYTVTVAVALSPAKAITAFSLNGVVGTINEAAKTIAVTMPFGTDVTALVATFTTTGNSVKVGSTVQISGATANNFSSSVIYTVTAADATTQDYTVTVTVSSAAPYTVSTVVNSGLSGPSGITIDGTNLYVINYSNNTINKIDLTNNNVSTIVGSGLLGPEGITIFGTNLYFTDMTNNLIKKIDLANGNAVTTIAGNGAKAELDADVGTNASFNQPFGIAINAAGTILYVTDEGGHTIRQIELTNNNKVTTIVPDNGWFTAPEGITRDGNNLYVSDVDASQHGINKIDLANGNTLSHITNSGLVRPCGMTVYGTNLYVADVNDNKIKKIDLANGNAVTTIAGSGSSGEDNGAGTAATFTAPESIIVDATGANLYVTDFGGNSIRKITLP